MSDTMNDDLQMNETGGLPGEDTKMETPDLLHAEESGSTPGNFREASYVILFVAAVFVINAMETGSYRTPWPVALLTALVGFGLFGYSWYLQSRSKDNT